MNNKQNQQSREHSPSHTNPYKEDFEQNFENEEQDDLAQSVIMKIPNKKFYKEMLGEELKETLLENKINKKCNRKPERRRSSKFLSSKEIIQIRDSLKDIGVISEPNEEHLTIRKLPNITETEYDQKINKITNLEKIENLYKYIQNLNFNFKDASCGRSVGGISPLTYLVEMQFCGNKDKLKEMYEKYNLLKPYMIYYRTICGDGNCFYRAVIFRYLEILVLNNNISILQKIILDFIESFTSPVLQKRRIINNNDIKPDLTITILSTIVELLKKKLITEAHQILVKCFCLCPKFDYAIILYFRYILYDYIKKNENKIYLKSFPVKIGNLLPSQFENLNGEFLFNDFYEKYLLKFFTDAEKIIIYLTPFVLGIELNVVVPDLNETDILQKFSWEGETEITSNDVISLLNNRNHYEIIYTQKDEDKNKQYFELYKNNFQPRVLFQEDKNNLQKNNNNDNDNDDDDGDFNLLKSYKDLKIPEIKPKTTINRKKNNLDNNINNVQNNTNTNTNNQKNNTNNNNHNITMVRERHPSTNNNNNNNMNQIIQDNSNNQNNMNQIIQDNINNQNNQNNTVIPTNKNDKKSNNNNKGKNYIFNPYRKDNGVKKVNDNQNDINNQKNIQMINNNNLNNNNLNNNNLNNNNLNNNNMNNQN